MATLTEAHVFRLDVHEPGAGYDAGSGKPYWSRCFVAHMEGGGTLTVVLLSDRPDGLDLHLGAGHVADHLTRLSVEELDSLSNAVRAERQSRHPEPTQDYICAYCGLRVASDEGVPAVNDDAEWARLAGLHKDGCEWCRTRAHRREPPPDDAVPAGVTVTEDDGVPF